MALLPQGILGPFSGKVGPVVGCICKTRSFYVRSLPKHYRDARTPEQLRNRARLKMLMGFLSAAKPFVNRHLGGEAVGMTATNVATRLNFHEAVGAAADGQGQELLYDRMVLSRGRLAVLDGLTVVRDGGRLLLGWNGGAMVGEGSGRDRVSVMVYDAARDGAVMRLGEVMRMERGMVVEVPGEWMGEDWHVFVAVTDERGWEASDTQYVGFVGADAPDDSGRMMADCVSEERGELTDSSFFDLEKVQSATKEVLGLGRIRGEEGARGGPEG